MAVIFYQTSKSYVLGTRELPKDSLVIGVAEEVITISYTGSLAVAASGGYSDFLDSEGTAYTSLYAFESALEHTESVSKDYVDIVSNTGGTATSLESLPLKPSMKVTITAAQPTWSYISTPYEGFMQKILLVNSTGTDITQAIPNTGGWVATDKKVVTIPANDSVEIEVWYTNSTYRVKCSGQLPTGFITEWTVSGDATARTITLPLVTNYSYNFIANWGDGTASTITASDSASRIHEYAANGVYRVEITGTCEAWSFNNAGDKLKVTDIIHWGNSTMFGGFKYFKGGMYGCANLKSFGKGVILASGNGCTTEAFMQAFALCILPKSVPVNLFSQHLLASTYGFYQVFLGNSSLETIPEGLWRLHTAVGLNGFRQAVMNCPKLRLNKYIFFAAGEESTRFLNRYSSFIECFSRSSFTGTQGSAPELWLCDFGESMTLDVAPATDWATGDIITGQTSGATCVIVSKTSALVYRMKQKVGTFTLGEVIGVTGTPAKLADQGAAKPTFSGDSDITDCFNGAGNSATSLDNYASIPARWI